jgi:DNA end-binding protein Ku
MSTLRSDDEVRRAEFGAKARGEVDADVVTIAETIIERQSGAFGPASFRNRYQDALRESVDAKTKGLANRPGDQFDRSLEAQPCIIIKPAAGAECGRDAFSAPSTY